MESCNGYQDVAGRNGECRPGSLAAGDRLVGEVRFVHRFDRRPCFLLTVRTYETATGERYSRDVFEPYPGL
jgi:hypothetical protein